MMTSVPTGAKAQVTRAELATTLEELAQEGARRMSLAALEVEVAEYLARHRNARDERGHALVVRNGTARRRRLTVGARTVTIQAPRVHNQRGLDGVRQKFTWVESN